MIHIPILPIRTDLRPIPIATSYGAFQSASPLTTHLNPIIPHTFKSQSLPPITTTTTATPAETRPLLGGPRHGLRRFVPMYTPPIVEEEEQEAAEESEYEAQFEPAEAPGANPKPTSKPSPPVAPDPAVAGPAEEMTEAPHILVDLPLHVEETVQELTEQGGRCGVGRCRAWLIVLREELRHEEQWRLPVLPRNAFIDFKWRRPPPPERAAAEVPNPWFVLYRVLLLAYWSSWVTVAIVGAQSAVHIPPPVYEHLGYNALWLIFVTNWTAFMLLIYLALACLSLAISAPPAVAVSPGDGVARAGRTMADSLRTVTWALRDTVAPACVMVMLLYWLLLFPIFGYTNVVDVHLHLVNALIILADLWLSRQPYWLRHFYWPLAYLCSYIVFAGIYYGAGGKDPDGEDFIYPWLDFERPHVTVPVIFLIVFVIFPTVHSSLWALERRSRQVAKRRFEREEAEWAAEEEVKDELATRPGETGRRRRQRRQRLVSPAQEPGSGRSHSQRCGWPWESAFRPLTPDEMTALRQELLLNEESEEEESGSEKSFKSAESKVSV